MEETTGVLRGPSNQGVDRGEGRTRDPGPAETAVGEKGDIGGRSWDTGKAARARVRAW